MASCSNESRFEVSNTRIRVNHAGGIFIPLGRTKSFWGINFGSASYPSRTQLQEAQMGSRRSFLKIAGTSLGIGALYSVLPKPLKGETAEMARWIGAGNGEQTTPFTFVQMSDAHVGFNGPPDPLGTKAFERAVELINGLPQQPDL